MPRYAVAASLLLVSKPEVLEAKDEAEARELLWKRFGESGEWDLRKFDIEDSNITMVPIEAAAVASGQGSLVKEIIRKTIGAVATVLPAIISAA